MAYTTIKKPSDYFNTKLYTGNDTGQSITGVNFTPDFVWIKSRTDTNSHNAWDSVRGVNKYLEVDTTKIETTVANGVTSFDSDGFTVGSRDAINDNGLNFVSWNWLGANGTASNTDGSITSTVSANTTSGFSIVSYTGNGTGGATVGHGLGTTPSMIIVKSRDNGTLDWGVYHKSIGNTGAVYLDLSNAPDTSAGFWNNTSPNSSVFTLGVGGTTNNSGDFIAYCFAEKQGFSKFGSYTGNGNNDGTFIYTGFKPAFVIIKSTSTNTWIMLDNKRGSYNVNQSKLFADDSSVENTDTSNGIDFLSNGLKLRRNNSEINTSGQSYIYMAFAEEPLVGDNPATAR